MDICSLFSGISNSNKSIIIKMLDDSVDVMVKEKGMFSDEEINETIEDLKEFANELRVGSKYSLPVNEHQ